MYLVSFSNKEKSCFKPILKREKDIGYELQRTSW